MLYISAAIKNKVLNILENGNFFSILSDGSQARKTKHDKDGVNQNRKKRCFIINKFDLFSSSQFKLLLARNTLLLFKSFVVNLRTTQMRYFFKHQYIFYASYSS